MNKDKLIVVSSNSQNGNAYWYEYEDGKAMLIECGCSWKKLSTTLGKKRLSMVDTMYLSHNHIDHIKSTTFRSLIKEIPDIKVVMHEEVVDGFLDIINIEEPTFSLETEHHLIKFIELIHFNSIRSGNNGKDRIPTYGFYIQNKILFITDTGEYKVDSVISEQTFDFVLLECNYDENLLETNKDIIYPLKERIKRSHLSTNQYIEIKNKLKYKNIIPTHLSKSNQLTYDKISLL